MGDISIVDASVEHARTLGRHLRALDRQEIRAYGVMPEDGVEISFHNSLLRKTGLVDGDVAAMWGVIGSPLGIVGMPWLLTGNACEKVSAFAFSRIYREQVREMLKLFPVLENWVDCRYTSAMRMLRIAGFHLGEPRPVGPSGDLFRRFEVRA